MNLASTLTYLTRELNGAWWRAKGYDPLELHRQKPDGTDLVLMVKGDCCIEEDRQPDSNRTQLFDDQPARGQPQFLPWALKLTAGQQQHDSNRYLILKKRSYADSYMPTG